MTLPDPDTTAGRFLDLLRRQAHPVEPGEAALGRLLAATRVINVAKGDTVLRAGDVAEYLFHIDKGLLRYFYLDEATGDERTGQFFDEGGTVTDAASFLTGAPATQTIEAIEESVLLIVPRIALLRAYDEDHATERFGRKMIEAGFVGLQRRAANLLNMSPDDRYRYYVQTRPEIVRRVPQYLLASFLGITPESLSRIRGRMARPDKSKL
ncbi:Crp/Fnr family transcriptional regulator [Sphingobium algorifonticola]|uniref:Crp/Fnr family transcriptional regulator n=1 Tax=Sphingobium algorifonticola TaxID=2008318 RepID=A0A437J4U5_9SPHN|nr:Crp/Fnr family transcriptional regulator [Sphingobium algorifonticola]RVT39776.1 Crp/Fnr family transcriptional regulator [Sphingobium algorifonticola]